ncbi:hypothetical protein BH20ACI4_BH20ACI4_15200 [soil metagenome]
MWKKFTQYLKNNNWLDLTTIFTVLTIKTLILVFAFHSYQVISNNPMEDWQTYLKFWSRWDAESYLWIAEHGYTAVGEKRFLLVFFPLYPLLIKLVELVTGNYKLSAFIVSGIASIVIGLLFRLLIKLDFSEKTAQQAILFLFIFPTSYFLHIPYTESLFIALVIGCFWAARTEKWIVAGILGFLACLTRINGIILFPALLFEIWEQYNNTKKVNWVWLTVILIPLGCITYLLLNFGITGNAFMFLEYQRQNWGKYLRLPFDGLWGKFQTILTQNPENSNMVGFQELLFIAIGFFAIVLGWKYLRNSYKVWMVVNWLLFISTSFILSVPRYTLTMFPIFILMALVARQDWRLNVLFTFWSILYLGLFSSLFFWGHWAF